MKTTAQTDVPEHLETGWLRRQVEELSAIHRPSASPGERQAAEWLVARLGEQEVEARIEVENGHGGYWWPLGLANAVGALGGIAAGRGHRLSRCGSRGGGRGGGAGRAATARVPVPEDAAAAGHHNVVAELGPADAERTVVLVAHHDAAHPGLVFHPAIPKVADRLGLIEKNNTSPGLMWPLVGGSAAVAAGALSGSWSIAGVVDRSCAAAVATRRPPGSWRADKPDLAAFFGVGAGRDARRISTTLAPLHSRRRT